MNIILQFYPRWNTSSGSSATRWRCSDARAPPWYRREPESSRYKVCPKTVWRPIWSNLSLSRIHTLAVYHSSLIGRVSPTTPSNQPRHPPTNQPTTNKTCPSTGGERTEFDKYKYTIPSTFSLSNNPKYTLQSFVAVGDQQHASLCAAYHPAWMDDPRTRTIHTRSWKHGEGEGEEGEGKKKKKQKGELVHVKAAAATTASRLRDAKSGHGVSRRSRVDTKAGGRGGRGESTRHGERKKTNRSRPKSAANWLVRGCFGPLNASREAPGSGTPASRSRSAVPLVGGIKRWA